VKGKIYETKANDRGTLSTDHIDYKRERERKGITIY
jgi:hypothetical protein